MTTVMDSSIQQTLDVSATAPLPVVKEEPFDPASFESAAAPLPLPSGAAVETLFGRYFNPPTATAAAAAEVPLADPTAFDVQREIESLFGPAAMADLFHTAGVPAEPTAAEIDATVAPLLAAEALEEMSDLFGPAGAAAVAEAVKANQSLETSTVLVMPRLPAAPVAPTAAPAAGKKEGETWVIEMPSVNPNRQTLHVETHPFNPNSAESVRRESGPRALYTPYNTIRWTKIDAKGDGASARLLSNARLVRWSDGSVTLHVGADVYNVRDSREAQLRIVGRSIRNPADGSRVFIETVPYNREVQLQPAVSIPNSVNEAVLSEVTMRRSVDITSRLSLLQDAERVVETQPAAAPQAQASQAQREQFAVPAAVQAAAVAALQGRSSVAAPASRLSTVPGIAGASLAGASQLLASQSQVAPDAAAATGAAAAELAEYRRQHDRQREQKLRELHRQGKSCSPFDVLSSDIEAADVCRAAQGGDLGRLHATLEAQVRAAQARGIEEAQRKRAAAGGRLDARRIDTDELERELTAGRRRSRSSSPIRVTVAGAAAGAPSTTAAAAALALPATAYTSKEALREAVLQRLDGLIAAPATSDETREMAKMQAEMVRGEMGDAVSLDTLRDTWERFVQEIAH